MLHYVEFAPSPALADRIESFWTMRLDGPAEVHRVLPDGCTDLLLTLDSDRARLDCVGPMTTWRDHRIESGRQLLGVRFHPGRGPLAPIPDAILDLEDLWGNRASRLRDRLVETPSIPERVRLIEASLSAETVDPVTRAVAQLGRIPLDDLARATNLSPRQFRRVCEAKTGYSPKLLARILRFRRATAQLAAGERPIDVALSCGYYDQSHFINESKALSGRSPIAPRRRDS